MRPAAALLGCCLLLAAGCSGNVQVGAPPGEPDCASSADTVSDALILVAQTVPTAQQVPCLRPLPLGWSFTRLDAQSGRTRVYLRSADRDGDHTVTISLTGSCDLAGAQEVRTDRPAARRYDRVPPGGAGYRGDQYYVFQGGCITYHFELRGRAGADAAATVAAGFGFVSRSTVAAAVSQRSHGRLTLDPGGQS